MRFSLSFALLFATCVSAVAAEPAPGSRFQVDPARLPPPNATPSTANPADVVRRPAGAGLVVPRGYRAALFAEGLGHARNLMVLPNGDVLVAEQKLDKVTLLRDADGDGKAEVAATFADGFAEPFGLALHEGRVWVADTLGVWALDWRPGETRAGRRTAMTARGEVGEASGHSTRSLIIHPDGRRFFVGIGSEGNIAVEPEPRATVRVFAMGEDRGRTFAAGLRNPVGLAFRPGTEELWAVVNERDGLGDELVPDYLVRLAEGAFYGWPYSYIGANPQPRFAQRAPDRVKSARVPELLFRSHSAPLGLAFWKGDAIVALHGSWNRSSPAGYFVARVPFQDGKPVGHYEVFASGFLVSDRSVWGRPVGVAVGPDDALYLSDDAGQTVWRVVKE